MEFTYWLAREQIQSNARERSTLETAWLVYWIVLTNTTKENRHKVKLANYVLNFDITDPDPLKGVDATDPVVSEQNRQYMRNVLGV